MCNKRPANATLGFRSFSILCFPSKLPLHFPASFSFLEKFLKFKCKTVSIFNKIPLNLNFQGGKVGLTILVAILRLVTTRKDDENSLKMVLRESKFARTMLNFFFSHRNA